MLLFVFQISNGHEEPNIMLILQTFYQSNFLDSGFLKSFLSPYITSNSLCFKADRVGDQPGGLRVPPVGDGDRGPALQQLRPPALEVVVLHGDAVDPVLDQSEVSTTALLQSQLTWFSVLSVRVMVSAPLRPPLVLSRSRLMPGQPLVLAQ